MMYSYTAPKKLVCCLFLLLFAGLMFCVVQPASAQFQLFEINPARKINFTQASADTLAGIFREARNPAGLRQSGLSEKSLIYIGSGVEAGSFRQIQQANRLIYGTFNAEGTQQLNEWYVSGKVNLTRGISEGVQFFGRAPVPTFNPYQWADTTGGNWTNNLVRLSGAVGSPLLNDRFTFGFSAEYDVKQGARQNVERPLFQYSRYRFAAGSVYKLSPRNEAAFHAFWGEGKQENEIGFFNQLNTFVLLKRGIGTFSQTSFNSASRTYSSFETGGGIQLVRTQERFLISAALSYEYLEEDAVTGISNPVQAGLWQQQNLAISNAIVFLQSHTRHELRFRGSVILGEGTDPILNGVNTEAWFTETNLQWSRLNTQNGQKIGLGIHFLRYTMNDRVSVSEQLHSRLALDGLLSASLIRDQLHLVYQPSFSVPLENDLLFKNANIVIDQIFAADQNFLEQSVISNQLSISYRFISGRSRVGLGFRVLNQTGFGSNNRMFSRHRTTGGFFLLVQS